MVVLGLVPSSLETPVPTLASSEWDLSALHPLWHWLAFVFFSILAILTGVRQTLKAILIFICFYMIAENVEPIFKHMGSMYISFFFFQNYLIISLVQLLLVRLEVWVTNSCTPLYALDGNPLCDVYCQRFVFFPSK